MSDNVPRGWSSVRVGDLARTDEQPVLTGPFGTNIGREDFVPEGCPVLTIGCLTDAGIKIEKAMFVREAKAAELDRYRLRSGDLLFSRMASVGRAGMVPDGLDGALFNYHIMRLRLADEKMLPKLFLAYVRGAPGVRRYLEDVNHGATRDGINTSQLLELPVLLPPLNEQRRIVAKLEALQTRSRRAREALDAVPPLLEKLRQSILAAAFRGDLTKDWRAKNKDVEPASKLLARIRTERRKKWEESELAKMKAKGKPSTEEKWKATFKDPSLVDMAGLPELPPGWCWTTVESLLPSADSLFDGPFGSALKTEDYVAEGVRVLRLENIANLEFRAEKRTFISSTKYESLTRHTVAAGDIIFGSFVEESTRVCMLPELGGPAIAKADCFCLRPDPHVVSPELLTFALGSHRARTELARGIHGATRARINTGQLRALRVPLPPMPEQVVMLERLQAMLTVVSTLRRVHEQCRVSFAVLERAVLAKAFRGELVCQDPNDEPAEVMLARVDAGAGASTESQESEAPTRSERRSKLARGATAAKRRARG